MNTRARIKRLEVEARRQSLAKAGPWAGPFVRNLTKGLLTQNERLHPSRACRRREHGFKRVKEIPGRIQESYAGG